MSEEKITPAGLALLQRFLQVEADTVANTHGTEKLIATRNERLGLKLPDWDGGAKAAAKRLDRQGLAECHWPRHGTKLLFLTEKGRAFMEGRK